MDAKEVSVNENDAEVQENKDKEEPQQKPQQQQQQQGRRKKKKNNWKPLTLDYSSTPAPAVNDQRTGRDHQHHGYGQNTEQSNTSSYRSGNNSYPNSQQRQSYQPGSSNRERFQRQPNDGPRSKKDYENISRFLATALRHGHPKLDMDRHGYAVVETILSHPQFMNKFGNVTEKEIQFIVDDNSKKRYELNRVEGVLKIRATQGHSVQVDIQMEEITNPNEYPHVIHGTYKESWRRIKLEGLKRFSRQHIHFAPGLLGETHVVSGMRVTCDIIIYLDMNKAIANGLKFYKSVNNVILTEGNLRGVVPPEYFKRVTKYNTKTDGWDTIVGE